MQATPNLNFTAVTFAKEWLQRFVTMIRSIYENLVNVINGNLGFGDGTKADNISGAWINVTAPAAPNTNFTVTHNLGRLPVGYWVMQKDRACDVFTGTIAATKTQLTLQATVASAVLRLFVVLVLLSLLSYGVGAQTTVNLTVQDTPDNQTWNNGTWSATLKAQAGQAGGPPFNIISGGGSTAPQNGALSVTGTATMSLPANSNIAPAHSVWLFQVCPLASSPCVTQEVVVSTSSPQTLNITPPSPRINMFTAPPPVTAYLDGELTGVVIGNTYFNSISLVHRYCVSASSGTCFTWQNVGTGSTVPGGSPIQTQVNNAGAFGGTPCENFNNLTVGPENVDCDWHSKGPNPWFDVTRFGASGSNQSTTGSINSGSSTLTLASAKDFANGQGIMILNAGATSVLTAPACTAVAWGQSGATTYSYQLYAVDANNGMSPAATCNTGATGATTLGNTNTATISSITRNGSGTVTVTTSAAHNFLVNADVIIQSVTDGSFNCAARVESVADNTHFTYNQKGPAITSSGGTAKVLSSVQLTVTPNNSAVSYALYGRTGGTFNFIRMISPLAATPNTFVAFDYGNGAGTPLGIPATGPVSATAGNLFTTITSGGGTTTLVLATTASNSVSGVAVQHDETAAFNSAMSAASTLGGRVRLPSNGTFNTGPLTFPATNGNTMVIEVEGQWIPWSPIVITRSYTQIVGGTQSTAVAIAFQNSNASIIQHNNLSPVIYEVTGTKSVVVKNITINGFVGDAIQIGTNNGGTAPVSWTIDNCNLAATNGASGYGSAVYYAQANGFGGSIVNGSYGGPVSNPVPTFHFTGVAQIFITGTYGGLGVTISSRGIVFDGLGSPGGFDYGLQYILTESNADPYFVKFDNGSSGSLGWGNITLRHVELADSVGFGNLNAFNWTFDNVNAPPISVFIDGLRGGQSTVSGGGIAVLTRATDTSFFAAGASLPGAETNILALSSQLNAFGNGNRLGNCPVVPNTTATMCPASNSGAAVWMAPLTGQSNDVLDIGTNPGFTKWVTVDSAGGFHSNIGLGSTGLSTFTQAANGNNTIVGIRATDVSPTGNYVILRNNANNATVFQIDVSGNVTANAFTQRIISGGSAPTCAVTGAGTGATCTLSSFSTDNSGAMQINSGTTPGSSGTWTLTFSAGFPNAAFCTVGPGSGGTTLNARATVFDNTNGTLGVHAGNWDNNGVAINASQSITFIISYVCGGH